MITYLYWTGVIALAFGLFYFIGYKVEELKIAAIASFTVLAIGFVAYTFHFQQIFVKRYGGIMTVKVPEKELHLAATWKDDNLWIENYNPQTNTCHFREYSRGNLLQGEVIIKNCNPLLRRSDNSDISQP
ncbi:MAG: hypothetical protein RQ982_08385 [Gammaproteobacteria bacterium]|nr:hypothetical protein [Gammaproteobacteria bacterium]